MWALQDVRRFVFDNQGEAIGYGFSEYPIICDEPAKAEQDASEVMKKLIEVAGQAIRQSCIQNIEAISVSVQGDAAILVDKSYHPIHFALLGMDYRNTNECTFLEEHIGSKEAFQRTGMRIHPINFLAKVLWYKNHAKDAFAQAYKVITYSEFVLVQLGGEPLIDLTMASRTMAMDIHRREWDLEILNSCGIDKMLLSKITTSGTPCGRTQQSHPAKMGP